MNGSSLRVRHRAPTIGWRREQRWRSQSSNAQFTQSVSATNNNQVHLGDRLHRAITWEQQHAVAPPRALSRAQARASLDTEASATLAGKSTQRQRRPSTASARLLWVHSGGGYNRRQFASRECLPPAPPPFAHHAAFGHCAELESVRVCRSYRLRLADDRLWVIPIRYAVGVHCSVPQTWHVERCALLLSICEDVLYPT